MRKNSAPGHCLVDKISGYPLDTVKETTAYIVTENGTPRIIKVTIKGENVVHIF